MKKQSILFALLLVFVLTVSVCGMVSADDNEALPAFTVSDLVSDTTVTLMMKNFPAEAKFSVYMADEQNPEASKLTAKFNSVNGGTIKVTLKIPEFLQGVNRIMVVLKDENGTEISGNFVNIEADAETETEVAEESAEAPQSELSDDTAEQSLDAPADASIPESENTVEEEQSDETTEDAIVPAVPSEVPAPMPESTNCDYSVTPYFNIDSVVKGSEVTVTTHDFPADSTFTVSMGTMNVVSGCAQHKPCCSSCWYYNENDPRPDHDLPNRPWHPADSRNFPSYNDEHMPKPFAPVPAPFVPGPVSYGSVFNGVSVATYETGDGSSQTLTFTIPEEYKNFDQISIWFQDDGPCGFYSYNYFYNLY